MGSLKKKFARTLRKITPKEIAPILPFIAMAIPGMQGLTPLMKFALPQLLTAAGSARQTGKINLANQALAGLGSFASMNAANAANANQLAASAAGEGGKYLDALGNVAGATEGLNATQLATAQTAAEAAAKLNPSLSAANTMANQAGFANQLANSRVFNNAFVQPFGTAINNPGFNMPYALAVGGSGGSMATGDYAGKKQLKFEEDQERDQGYIDAYKNATSGLADYLANREYTLEDLYGSGNVPDFLKSSFLAANGGRAQLYKGGMSPGERNAREGHQRENSSSNNSGGQGGNKPSIADISGPANTTTNTNTDLSGSGKEKSIVKDIINESMNFKPNVSLFDPAYVDPNAIDYGNIDDEDDNAFNEFDVGPGTLTIDGNPFKKEVEFSYGFDFANGGRVPLKGGGDPGGGGAPKPVKKDQYNPATMLPQGKGQTEMYNAYMQSLPKNNIARENYFNTGVKSLSNAEGPTSGYKGTQTGVLGSRAVDDNQILAAIAMANQYNPFANNLANGGTADGGMDDYSAYIQEKIVTGEDISFAEWKQRRENKNNGGIMGAMQAPGVPSGMELDYRESGGFIPMGGPERADDVPAMLSKNEFVMTADAVRAAGDGNIEDGAQRMYDLMNTLEAQA